MFAKSKLSGGLGIILSQRYWHILLVALLVGSFSLSGCSSPTSFEGTGSESVAPTPTVSQPSGEEVTAFEAYKPRLEGLATVEMIVKGQKIIIEINGEEAPVTAGNFVDLVERGVYDGLAFHRVIKDPQPFVAQGGDPTSKDPNVPISALGTGGFVDPATGIRQQIPLEIKLKGDEKPTYGKDGLDGSQVTLKHERGAIAMARSQMPNSASSQFYFALASHPFLDGNYAVFGKVTEGMDVVESIEMGDRIESAKVIAGSENLVK